MKEKKVEHWSRNELILAVKRYRKSIPFLQKQATFNQEYHNELMNGVLKIVGNNFPLRWKILNFFETGELPVFVEKEVHNKVE